MKPDFAEIKRTTDLVRVIEGCGVALKKCGADYVGLCPFHEDKKPSLRVTPGKGLWRCPACGAAGNVIQFVARKEGLTDREAALKLLGAVPGVKRASELPGAAAPAQIDEATRAKLLARVANFYAKTLRKDRAGLDYLQTRRLDDAAALETFAVGYCNGALRAALPKGGEVVAQLQALGVLNERGNEVMFGRVVVPIYDAAGDVANLYGRRISDEEPRHLYLRGERRGVFNAQAAKAHQCLILVESVFDALSLWSAGFRNAVALYGADGWTDDHAALVRENGVTELVLALDNDAAGAAGAAKLLPQLAELGALAHRLAWPDGVKDANDFFSSRSAADFQALLDACKPKPAEPPPTAAAAESIAMTEHGFHFTTGARRYELFGIEKPHPARLKATVKALANAPATGGAGRFHIDTVEFYQGRSRRGFISEAARLFRASAEEIEADVQKLLEQVESYVAQRLEEKAPVALLTEADKSEGARLGKSRDLLAEIQSDLGKLGLVGEETNRLVLYLAMTSRKMDDPLAVHILSASGAGKSHLQDAVLSLCPDEELIKLTSLTDRALFYKGEDSLKHKALAIAEVAGADGARYALRSLISDKKLVIESTIKNPASGRLETQVNTVYGPTAVFETTTQPDTDPETKSRFLILSVDESPAQTLAILEAQRAAHTLEGVLRRKHRATVIARQHAFQRLLRPVVVINPFEPLLRYGGADGQSEHGRLTFRRDNPKYLQLILAVTFLHQLQRPAQHHAEIGDYIETTLDDIAAANALALALFGSSLDELSAPARRLWQLICGHAQAQAVARGVPLGKVEVSRRELLAVTGWSYHQLRTHLPELVEHEYLAPVCGRFGQRYLYRLLAGAEETPAGVGLKSVEQLRKEAQTLRPCGVLENLAGTLRGEDRKVPSPAEPHECRASGATEPNLAARNGKHMEEIAR